MVLGDTGPCTPLLDRFQVDATPGRNAMLLRLARFDHAPTDERDWVIEALEAVPGVRAAYHAVDRETGAMLSISVYDDQVAADAGFGAIAASAAARNHHGVPPDETRF